MEHQIITLQKFVQRLTEEEEIFKQYLPETLTDEQKGRLHTYYTNNHRDIARAKLAIKRLRQKLRAKRNRERAIKIWIEKKKQRALAILARKQKLHQQQQQCQQQHQQQCQQQCQQQQQQQQQN